jgi:hypothetical protein
MIALSLAMGVAVSLLAAICGTMISTETFLGKLVQVIVPVAGGIAVYGGAALALRMEEVTHVLGILRKKAS